MEWSREGTRGKGGEAASHSWRWPEEAKGPGKFCVLFCSVLKLREPERGRAAGTVAVSGDQDLRCRKGDTGQATHSDTRDSSMGGRGCNRGGKDSRQLGTGGEGGEVLGFGARREKPEIVTQRGGDRRLGNSFQQRWAWDPMEVPGYEFPRTGVPPGER